MKREVPLSDKAREVLEKQLKLLIDQSEWVPEREAAKRALAILNLIEVLEADDRCRERIARAEEYIKVMREAQEEEEALETIREQAEQARRGKRRRMNLIVGSIFLLAFFGILLFWML